MISGQTLGLIEMIFTAVIVLGFLGWQYWLVRDAGKPDASPEDPRHPEGEHQADDR